MAKTCLKCGGAGPFAKDRSRPDGLHPYCSICKSRTNKLYRESQGDAGRAKKRAQYRAQAPRILAKMRRRYYERRDEIRERLKRNRKQRPDVHLLSRIRGSAKKRGFECAITLADIYVPTHCPLLGIPLTHGNGRPHAGSPTIDRLDSRLGYVPGNVWVISYRANTIKNDASLAELEMIVAGLHHRLNSLPV